MKTTRIKVRNLFGIKEQREFDGSSIEISGPKGAGKTSVLDSIRYALTNRSDRDYIIHQGREEGEIIIETDTGLTIDRKARTNKADAITVKDGGKVQNQPASFLKTIFTPLQLNPVEFTLMSKEEKNRVILNLIDYQWSMEWIREQFGEIPSGVNYDQHILQVLADIQSERGEYFRTRQDINRDIRNQAATIKEIANDIPQDYEYEKWKSFDIAAKYRQLEEGRVQNSRIDKAISFTDAYENKKRGIEAKRTIEKSIAEKEVAEEKNNLGKTIERLKAEIRAAEDKLQGLDTKLDDKYKLIDSQFETELAKLESDTEISQEWAEKEPVDLRELQAEIDLAENMRQHLNEYKRMTDKQKEMESLNKQSSELTRKIELARELPGKILKTATIPVDGLTVENGVPLINGLPISNISDGETLELCIDITIQKPGGLQIVLLDGAERLDTKSRLALYEKCKAKGLQLIATRVSDSDELEVTKL